MGYLQDFEKNLSAAIDSLNDKLNLGFATEKDKATDKKAFIDWIKEEILKSYHNGIEAGKKGKSRKKE